MLVPQRIVKTVEWHRAGLGIIENVVCDALRTEAEAARTLAGRCVV